MCTQTCGLIASSRVGMTLSISFLPFWLETNLKDHNINKHERHGSMFAIVIIITGRPSLKES